MKKDTKTEITVNKIIVVGDGTSHDRTLDAMLTALSKMDLGKVEVREKLLLVSPIYVVARVTLTWADGKKKTNRMISYGVSRKGWDDKPSQTTGINTATSRARKAIIKKMRRKIPKLGGWYEA